MVASAHSFISTLGSLGGREGVCLGWLVTTPSILILHMVRGEIVYHVTGSWVLSDVIAQTTQEVQEGPDFFCEMFKFNPFYRKLWVSMGPKC